MTKAELLLTEVRKKIKHQRAHHKEKEREWKAKVEALTETNESACKLLASERERTKELSEEILAFRTPTQKENEELLRNLEKTEELLQQSMNQVHNLEVINEELKEEKIEASRKARQEKRDVMLLVLQRSVSGWQSDLLHQYLDCLDEEREIERILGGTK